MSNQVIAFMEFVGLIGGAIGLVFLLLFKEYSSFLKIYWLLILCVLLVGLLKSASNVFEWSGVTLSLDWFEDFVEILQAILIGILFYSIFQHRVFEKVQESETRYRGLVQQMTIAQNEREDLLHKLEYKNRELQSIVYIASHDLKSPLVNILGFNGELRLACRKLSEMLKQSNCPELIGAVRPLVRDIQESQMFIESGGNKMQVLIDGLLTVSRIGTQPILIQRIDMNAMLEGVLRTMKYQIQTAKAQVHVGELPPCMGDPAQVNQVFTNLIDNALKYLKPDTPGAVSITGQRDGKMSVYRVTDNGIGIRQEYFSKIFEIYHRLNPESENSGQGLGLTIVLRIMERLGGEVSLESNFGKGSTFVVKLPSGEN